MFFNEYFYNFKRDLKKEFTLENVLDYWENVLLEYCMKIFKWENLPTNVYSENIEMELFLRGKCGFFKDNDKYITGDISLYGITDYVDKFTHFNYATALRSGSKTIGKDGIVIRNNSLMCSFYQRIHHYAFLLAHTDITLSIALVNTRDSKTTKAISEKYAQNARTWYNKLYNGAPDCYVDDGFMSLEIIPNTQKSNNSISELLSTREKILSDFLEEIGIKKPTEKRERMVVDEVSSDESMLYLNIKDMYDCRKMACDEINKLFGLNITVNCLIDTDGISNINVSRETSQENKGDENNAN